MRACAILSTFSFRAASIKESKGPWDPFFPRPKHLANRIAATKIADQTFTTPSFFFIPLVYSIVSSGSNILRYRISPELPLPETNIFIAPFRMDGWKMIHFLLGPCRLFSSINSSSVRRKVTANELIQGIQTPGSDVIGGEGCLPTKKNSLRSELCFGGLFISHKFHQPQNHQKMCVDVSCLSIMEFLTLH